MNRILLLVSLMILQSCSMWPYERDFDCPVSEGLQCKSLYEVSELADQGYFGSKQVKQVSCDKDVCNTTGSRGRGKR